MANGMQGYNNNGGTTSPTPYIKHEPQDDSHRFTQNSQQFNQHPDAYGMPANNHFQQHGGFDQNFAGGDSVDPSELTMPIQQNGGGFMQGFSSFPNNQGMSYTGGGGGLDDEDLLATLGGQPNGTFELDNQEQHENYPHMYSEDNKPAAQNMENAFSHTPENAPISSPYIRSFQHPQYRQLGFNGAAAETPSSYNASPVIGSDSTQGTNFDNYMGSGKRKPMPGMERTASQQSPATMSPKTPGIASLSLGGPEHSSLPPQPIQNAHMSHRHHKSLSGQWDTPGSQASYIDSPLSSPGHGPGVHAQIADVFKGKHASLPTKVENTGPAFQTQEAKRRRRRESHNMVERRRRDNINERIQELSHLVPHHRLEDEKVRKHLLNSGSLSPTTGASGSPPRATSMLAGGVGRRASGVPTTAGLGEEKDKGPNKGDILNGAVGWTRDLMWALHRKLEQEKELRDLVTRLGGTFPYEETEDERRMASELEKAVSRNGPQNFRYSRAPGTSLRVPGYTDYAGNPVQDSGSERVSPAASGGKSMQSGDSGHGTPQSKPQNFWNQGEGITFKEEDEYSGMDMS
jgi:hypothetical protein